MQSRAIELARESLLLAMLLSGPALAASLAVALVVGYVAARAQLTDPAVTHAPRALAVTAALTLCGAWMGATLLRFTRALWDALPAMVP